MTHEWSGKLKDKEYSKRKVDKEVEQELVILLTKIYWNTVVVEQCRHIATLEENGKTKLDLPIFENLKGDKRGIKKPEGGGAWVA